MAINFVTIYSKNCETCEEVLVKCQCPKPSVQLRIFREQCRKLLIENQELHAKLAQYEPILSVIDD